MINKLTSASR